MDGNSALNATFNHGFAYWIYGGFSVLAALFVWSSCRRRKGMHARDHAEALERRRRAHDGGELDDRVTFHPTGARPSSSGAC